jgi:prolyl-tRNA synthetase
MRAEAGPIGGDHSHEFLILAKTGESDVFLDKRLVEKSLGDRAINYDDPTHLAEIVDEWTAPYARADETHDQEKFETMVPEDQRFIARGIEVGHIFYFGTKYSEPLGASVIGPDGESVVVHSGSYGIGPSRLVAATIEASHDENGIIWPATIAPFDVAIVNLKQGDKDADAACEAVYEALQNAGLDVIYDDRDERAGAKFASMDLIGTPQRVTIGPRGLSRGVIEVTDRRTRDSIESPRETAIDLIVQNVRAAKSVCM